jgi:hypothetical protein
MMQATFWSRYEGPGPARLIDVAIATRDALASPIAREAFLRRREELGVATIKIYLDEHSDPPDATWTVARSAEDAWRMVLAHDVQAMSLGCDMGQCEACVASASLRGRGPFFGTCYHRVSGLEFCSWLAKAKLWPRARTTVHSVGLGAFQMRKIIARDFQLLESVDRLRPSPDADGFGR